MIAPAHKRISINVVMIYGFSIAIATAKTTTTKATGKKKLSIKSSAFILASSSSLLMPFVLILVLVKQGAIFFAQIPVRVTAFRLQKMYGLLRRYRV